VQGHTIEARFTGRNSGGIVMKVFALITGLAVATALGMAQTPATAGSQSGKNATSSSAQSQAKESKSSAKNSSESASTVKTQTYKGSLVDASCSGGGAAASSSPAATADRTSSDKSAGKNAKAAAKGEASRGGESANSCTPSSSTNDFALRTKDGHTLRFDAVGNERAKLAMNNDKKWKGASSSGKTIQTSVSGTESGDTLTVLSIH
jgi:hypothetical protein